MIKLIHGDCLEKMAEIEDGSIDMVLTDPPYGTTACKWDSIIPLEPMWEHLKRVIKPNGAIVMTASQPFTTTLIASNMKMFRYEWIWQKDNHTNFLNIKKQPAKRHENVCVWYKKQPTYNPQMWIGKENHSKGNKRNASRREYLGASFECSTDIKGGMKYPISIYKCNGEGRGKAVHPTQKPVALMEYLIKTYTNEGETVLDFTMGSGTTGVACKNLNRSFIGIEKDAEYFQIASDRIHSHNSRENPPR
jgi:site-specific DNA-methyltransferase (adenine-specific)